MIEIIPFQRPLRPALPTVIGNVDYLEFHSLLKRIDELLIQSGVERLFIEKSLEYTRLERGGKITARDQQFAIKHAIRALRCTLLRLLLEEDYRGMSRRLAECQLFQWFCHLDELGVVQVPGKSTLHRYAHWLSGREMEVITGALLQAASSRNPDGTSPLHLVNAVELDLIWMDSTAVKANIHIPVDWVLLRDAVQTLVKAICLIRKHGLKYRIPSPERFMSEINRLCIAMTQCRRKPDGKRVRKQTLRAMKRVVDTVARHARRYHALLDLHWEKTDWSRAQANEVLNRIELVLEKIPAIKHQAHERIIGGRQVPNREKLLSLYEEDINVIVRGKAGAAVEFGNTLLLAEQADGLIVDYKLFRDQAPSDSKCLIPSVCRIEALIRGPIAGLSADRQFDTHANRAFLAQRGAFNALCPRAPQELAQRRHEERFQQMQKRRAQTEGRIAIVKRKFLGQPLRAKGYGNREMAVHWAVLAHNLWVLARLERADELREPLPEAA